ncbi:long-chain-fatty-acid-CoA ligase [Mucidula mucida]|nr:long-chain-fatty-acid-CoA ligase [Mucidula mucida]
MTAANPGSWSPKRSLQETEELLCAPGQLHEWETRLVDGRLQRVYKNLPATLRDFWLRAVDQYGDLTYIVYGEERLTYKDVHERALHAAGVFYTVYGVRKGDRVSVVSRNCSEYLTIFWACHLIGAVVVLVNAWLPIEPLKFCVIHTQCRLLVVDAERAELLAPIVDSITTEASGTGVLILRPTSIPAGMESYHDAVEKHTASHDVLNGYPTIAPEDNCAIMFTSGTTGLPKGVLSTQRQFLTNVLNTIVGGRRAALRRGETLPQAAPPAPQKGALVAVPLFHVTGTTSYSMMATMFGMKIILMTKWVPEEGAKLIRAENITVAGGVPAMVTDLMDSSLAGYPLETLFFGGAPAPQALIERARSVFPGAQLSQGYGLTETNSISVAIAGEDYITQTTRVGLPSPVNDVVVVDVDTGKQLPPGGVGEIWIRGPNVMKCYWRDPEATSEIITLDGWLRSGDMGYQDKEGFLHLKDRSKPAVKDIIIRGGENVASVAVENALYADPRVFQAAAVGVPDQRLGELVAAVVSVKPAFRGQVTEESLIRLSQKNLPRFAVPVMVIVLNRPFELTPSGKIIKADLRHMARSQWLQRSKLLAESRL